MDRERFAKRLRCARTTRYLTQRELGQRVGLTNTMIYLYESGRSVPTLDRFVALCEALRVGADELLDYQAFPPPY